MSDVSGFTVFDVYERAVTVYKQMLAREEELTRELSSVREARLRQEGYVAAMEQIVGAMNGARNGNQEEGRQVDTEGVRPDGEEGNGRLSAQGAGQEGRGDNHGSGVAISQEEPALG